MGSSEIVAQAILSTVSVRVFRHDSVGSPVGAVGRQGEAAGHRRRPSPPRFYRRRARRAGGARRRSAGDGVGVSGGAMPVVRGSLSGWGVCVISFGSS